MAGLLNLDETRDVALQVRDHITPFLEEKGYVTNDELSALIATHTEHRIRGEKNLARVQMAMGDM